MAHRDDSSRADFFIDGQNLFLGVKKHFGYRHPNFDVLKMCRGLARARNWKMGTIFFYTGMPSAEKNVPWHDYWSRRLVDLGKNGVKIFNPPLHYIDRMERFADGTTRMVSTANEKGVDVRIAIDMFKSAIAGTGKIVLVSRDNDLGEAAKEIQCLAHMRRSSIEVLSLFPVSPNYNTRGVDSTTWIPMDKSTYDYYIDPRDFRSPGLRQSHEEMDRQESTLQHSELIGGRQKFNHEYQGYRPHAIAFRTLEVSASRAFETPVPRAPRAGTHSKAPPASALVPLPAAPVQAAVPQAFGNAESDTRHQRACDAARAISDSVPAAPKKKNFKRNKRFFHP